MTKEDKLFEPFGPKTARLMRKARKFVEKMAAGERKRGDYFELQPLDLRLRTAITAICAGIEQDSTSVAEGLVMLIDIERDVRMHQELAKE